MSNDFEYSITPLFSIPLFSTELKNITKEELEYVKNTEYKRFPVDNGYGSVSKFLLNEKPIQSLKDKIDEIVKTYLYGTKYLHCSHLFVDIIHHSALSWRACVSRFHLLLCA